jgi:hypothetical protein
MGIMKRLYTAKHAGRPEPEDGSSALRAWVERSRSPEFLARAEALSRYVGDEARESRMEARP